MNDADVYAALRSGRPRGGVGRALVALLVCALLAWFGWCAVWVARTARDAYIGGKCVDAGMSWDTGSCTSPPINLQLVPQEPESKPGPWQGGA